MSMRLPGASALSACLVLASAAAAQPPSPLTEVPGDAVIAIQLHGLDRTRARLTTTLKNALPKEGEQLAAKADAALKQITQGRDLKGAAKDGPVFLVFTKLPGPADMEEFQKSAVLMVATSNYKTLRDGLLTDEERKTLKRDPAGFETATIKDETVCLFPRGGFACITPSPAIAARLVKQKESDPGLTKKLGPAAASFLEPDLAVFVDLAAVNDQYRNEIGSFQQIVEFGLQQAEGGGVPGLDKSQVEAARMMFNGAFQAVEDCKVVLVSADFRPEGVALRLQTRFGQDSRSNELLKTFHPTTLSELGTLPTGQTTYSAIQFSTALQKIMGMMMGAGAGGATAEAAKKTAAALAELANGPILSASSFPPAGLTVGHYKDPAKAVELTMQLFKALPEGGAYQNAYLKGKPELKANAEKHRGFTFQYAHFRYDLDKMTAQLPDENARDAAKAAMKRLIGSDSHIWYGTDGKQFLTLVAKDWSAAQAVLDAYLDNKSLAKDAGYAALVKELPAESSLLFVANAPRLAVAMGDYMSSILKAMPGVPGEIPSLKAVAGAPAYVGLTLTLHSQEGRLDVFVTGAAVRAIRRALAAGAGDD